MENCLASAAAVELQQCSALNETQCALDASRPYEAFDGCAGAGEVQRAMRFASSDRTFFESDGPRARPADDVPYAKNLWRRFRLFWCTPAQLKALRVKALAANVLKISVGYSMLLCGLRFAEWLRWGVVPHSDWCRQLTAAAVCVAGICFGAPLAALLSTTAVLAVFPPSWLLLPKRKLSEFEKRMSDGFVGTPEILSNVIVEPLPETLLHEGVNPVSFHPAAF